MDKVKVAVAGRGTMGKPLIERLEREGFPVACSFTSKEIWCGEHSIPLRLRRETADDMAKALDPFMDGVEVMFLAIPSGPHETSLIDYCIERGIYAELFCKYDLAYNYRKRKPFRYMIGANATVGARTMSLPLLRMQNLFDKHFVMYAYLNASINFFMDEVATSGSAEGAFKKAKDNHLAEPGSDDYVSFVNAELGGDYPKKIAILVNDSIRDARPFISPNDITYIPVTEKDIERYTLPTHRYRYLIRIDNVNAPTEFNVSEPGSLYTEFGELFIYGGFCDVSRDTSISGWVKPGAMNGVQIRFKRDNNYEGQIEWAALGAGDATVGAAMNGLYEFIKARNGELPEMKWPRRA